MKHANHKAELERTASGLKNPSFPKIFAVELCADCDLNCSMCHHDRMQRPKGNLPMPLWRKCADEIAAIAPATNIWFSFCGEPLLMPERLIEMLKYGESVGLRSLNLNTNGMRLSREVARGLLDTCLSNIVIGIDGFTRETYEKYRVLGDRDRVYANAGYLLEERARRESGPEIMVQFIEMDDNITEFERYRDYWLGLGATVKLRRQLSWGGKFETAIEIAEEERIPCPWAITMMHMFWDGRVPRCPGDTEGEESAGNAWDDSLVDLWGRLASYRQLHLERRFGELPARCDNCTDWKTGASLKLRPGQAVHRDSLGSSR
ncbi:MAG: radical SAM protein [Pararhodobacter sp.]|nr:radical SAM protein [Pararhodobacter sp.]